MHNRPSNTNPSRALRIVRALALVPALVRCKPEPQAPREAAVGDGSSGGVVTQGGVVQGNTAMVQRDSDANANPDGEQRVEMRTVVVGQQPAPVCPLGQSIGCAPGLSAVCVATSAGPQWQCVAVVAAPVDRCALGAMQVQPERRCTCVQTEHGNDWRCALMRMDHGVHPVGPLPPPELRA